MKQFNFIFLTIFSAIILSSCSEFLDSQKTDDSESKLETLDEKASFVVGHDMGSQIKNALPNIDEKSLIQGVKAALNGEDKMFTDQQAKELVSQLVQKSKDLMPDVDAEVATNNLKVGQDYLAQLQTEPDYQITEEGIVYKVISSGEDGAMTPSFNSNVRVHYEGKLIDGTIFDSSYQRGQPAEFPLDRVIRGWNIIVQKMKVGDVWEVAIPSNLAYGERGNASIPANSTLRFKIELIAVLDN